jgi:hypothetical protein
MSDDLQLEAQCLLKDQSLNCFNDNIGSIVGGEALLTKALLKLGGNPF